MKFITDVNVNRVIRGREELKKTNDSVNEKEQIVRYLRSFKPCWFTTAPAEDPFTHEQVEEADFGYSDGEYTWYETEIYCFEKYNLALTDEFLAYIRKKLNIG